MGKFTKVFFGCTVVSICRFFNRSKSANPYSFPVELKFAFPLPACLRPIHAFFTAGIAGSRTNIARIFCMRTPSDILASIIQCIFVDVVAFFFPLAIQNEPMHFDMLPRMSSHRIETFSFRIPRSAPVPLIEPIKIVGVHDGILILCKRDKSVGFGKRLSDRVSLHAKFHWPSLKGLMFSAAIL